MSKAEKIRQYREANPSVSIRALARQFKCSRQSVQKALSDPPKESNSRPYSSFTETKDTAVAVLCDPNAKTIDDLIAMMKIDMSKWELVRQEVRSWPTTMREPATTVGGRGDKAQVALGENGTASTLWTRGSHNPIQVINTLVRGEFKLKNPRQHSVEILLEKIRESAPNTFELSRPPAAAYSADRSLEICIMDPHLGLLCQYPEADGPWDLDKAAGAYMQALDDLLTRSSVLGPFREIFMPFGNDFVHSDTVFHETTAGTVQPESISWHRVYVVAEELAIASVLRAKQVAPVHIYEIPGNHSRVADFTLARILKARFHNDKDVIVDASSSPYKFHRCGVNLIGFEHGHSIPPIRLAALMANECRDIWHEVEYKEWHLADQHRKGSPRMFMEEQGVSIEFIQGLTAPNEWHRLKAFSHQKRGAVSFVWDWKYGPIARFTHSISQYTHQPLGK